MAHVVVLVLGDLGRSPRMQYHASSFSHISNVTAVTQLGYIGERVMFPNDPVVVEQRFSPWEFNAFRRVALIHAVLKGFGILFKVFFTLMMLPAYDVIVIQNPPCLPSVLAAWVLSLYNGSIIVIDWHNLGFAMFEERLGKKHILVRIAFQLEKSLCRLAHQHICVSGALKDWLKEHFQVTATVLYDRPAKLFSKDTPSVEERHLLLSKLLYRDDILFPSLTGDGGAVRNPSTAGTSSGTGGALKSILKSGGKSNKSDVVREVRYKSTCQTEVLDIDTDESTHDGAGSRGEKDGNMDNKGDNERDNKINVSLRADRAKMIVSATSWTADEDFSMLLNALQTLSEYLVNQSRSKSASSSEAELESQSELGGDESELVGESGGERGITRGVKRGIQKCEPARLICVVTGKGPLKAEFEASVVDLTNRGLLGLVAVKTAWLSAADYSMLLRCADLGVSLHTSTSGLDLPMKVLDMFGSGLPVCAVNFPTIRELVSHGHNGLIFSDSGELAGQLIKLLYPGGVGGVSGISSSSSCSGNDSNSSSNSSSSSSSSRLITHSTGDDTTSTQPQPQPQNIENKNETANRNDISPPHLPPPHLPHSLSRLKEGACEIGTWEDNWDEVMRPLVRTWIDE